MPQYFSPGVYIQEVETGPVPIQGVSTSITGAVGITAKGPTSGKPILVTSFNDFQTTFGSFLTPPSQSQLNLWLDPVEGGQWWQFPLSVKGYFDNGGQQLYVKRVFSGSAVAASGNLGQGLIAGVAPRPRRPTPRSSSTNFSVSHPAAPALGRLARLAFRSSSTVRRYRSLARRKLRRSLRHSPSSGTTLFREQWDLTNL